MRIFIDSDYASLQAVVDALIPITGVKAAFYAIRPGSSPATVQSMQLLFQDNEQYIDCNLSGNVGAQPTEIAFQSDFPLAVVASINTMSY